MPDNTQMNCPTIKDVLPALCLQRPALLKKDGTINHNALARAARVNQPTVTRILSGESKQPKWDNLERLAGVFGVTVEQLMGYQAIPGLFPDDKYDYPVTETTYVAGVPGIAEQGPPSEISELDTARLVEWIIQTLPDLSPQARLSIAQAALSDLPKDVLPLQ